MKALVVEIKDGYAAVLLDDGLIKKVKNANYTIGEVIELKQKKMPFELVSKKKLIAIVSSAATFLIICGIGAWTYFSPYTYVSLDVNPSIEYSVNRYGTVLTAYGVNEDGANVLEEIGLDEIENTTIEDAVEATITEISEEGYFDSQETGGIVIATASEDTDGAQELADSLEEVANTVTEDNGDIVEVESLSVGLERVEEARELGVTPGKLNLVEKLIESSADPSIINLEEWLNKPVKEIMKARKANKGLTEEATTALQEQESEQQSETIENKEKNNNKEKNKNSETTVQTSTEITSTTEASTEQKAKTPNTTSSKTNASNNSDAANANSNKKAN